MTYRLLALLPLLLCAASKQRIVVCNSKDGIKCMCELKRAHEIVLFNCTREGGWSGWSEWSRCGRRRKSQKRRRRCDSPVPVGSKCEGEPAQSRKCNYSELPPEDPPSTLRRNVPEFLWGSWSGWNEWGPCSCPGNQRERTRHCIGSECSGCDVERGTCERRCVTERWWSDWSEWFSGPSKVRHRSWCSLGIDGKSLTTVLINETLSKLMHDAPEWSEWELRPGVAFRHRLTLAGPPDIQHQLIAHNSSTRVPLTFCLYLSITTMIIGFFTQCLISRMFSSCRAIKHRY